MFRSNAPAAAGMITQNSGRFDVSDTFEQDVVDDLNSSSGATCLLSVIVPTRNEEGNVALLLERLEASLRGVAAEVLFVDDSDDATGDAIRVAAVGSGLGVRLLHRGPEERAGGLATAVVAGMGVARGVWAAVMDGDLQHPPEVVPKMLAAARRRGYDLVVAFLRDE